MRRQKYRIKKEKSKSKSKILGYVFLALILSFISIFLYLFVSLPQLDKFIYFNEKENGDGELILVDGEVVKFLIPAETVLESSRGYGQYKLGSLWILSTKEGFSGDLVTETVLKNYLVPVHLWKRQNKTNLNLKQQLKIKTLRVDKVEAVKILASLDLPNSVLVSFVDSDLQESGFMVDLVDLTGNPNVTNRISSILGTMGTKISGYSKGYDENIDCQVAKVGDLKLSTKFSNLFGCEHVDLGNNNSKTIKIILGAKFAERF